MQVIYEEKKNKYAVSVDKNDKCFYCSERNKCTLIDALKSEYAVLRYEAIKVNSCNIYKKIKKLERIIYILIFALIIIGL